MRDDITTTFLKQLVCQYQKIPVEVGTAFDEKWNIKKQRTLLQSLLKTYREEFSGVFTVFDGVHKCDNCMDEFIKILKELLDIPNCRIMFSITHHFYPQLGTIMKDYPAEDLQIIPHDEDINKYIMQELPDIPQSLKEEIIKKASGRR